MSEQDNAQSHERHEHFLESEKTPVLKLMIIIVDWDQVKFVKELLREQFVRFQYVVVGKGTASSDILSVLGIGSIDKGIVFCLQPDFRASEVMRTVSVKLGLSGPGTGIAFTLPLAGIVNPAFQLFNKEQLEKLTEIFEPNKKERISYLFSRQAQERWENHMEMESDKTMSNTVRQYDLVVTVLDRGYSDELMNKAKAAGATGGTIIHATRIGSEDTVKFFGISLQAEKEVIAILTKRDGKNAIMKAISHSYGMSSEAKGIIFALPVDDIAGLETM